MTTALLGQLHRDTFLRSVALILWLLACITIVLSLAVWLARGSPRLPVSFAGGALGTSGVVLVGIVFSTVAAYLMAKTPRNVIGWIFIVIGLGMAATLPVNIALADAVRQFRLVDDPVLWVAWALTSVQVPASGVGLAIILLLLPTGRPSWRHWRLVAGMAIVGGAATAVAAALNPDGPLWYPTVPSPLVLPAAMRPVLGPVMTVGAALLVAGLVAAAGWLSWRSRHCDREQQRQLAWPLIGAIAMAVTLAPLFVGRYVITVSEATGERLVFAGAIGAIIFPITVALACQRSGLFGVRDIVGRSLVYLPLMAILAGVYSAAMALFQRLFVALTGTTSDAAIVLATLLVAASLTPVRHILESIVKHATETKLAVERSEGEATQASLSTVRDELARQLGELQARVVLLESDLNARSGARAAAERARSARVKRPSRVGHAAPAWRRRYASDLARRRSGPSAGRHQVATTSPPENLP